MRTPWIMDRVSASNQSRVRLERSLGLLREVCKVGRVTIRVDGEASDWPRLEMDESFALQARSDSVEVDAATVWGAMRALSRVAEMADAGGRLPDANMKDAPRYAWRGLMLDPARRFLSIQALKRTLLGMWAYRLNVLHLHLSDDQGLRLAIEGRTPPWPHYQRDELCELVTFAAELGIRVVPEIDLPGHATALLALCPELAKGQAPAAPSRAFGVHQAYVDCERTAVREAISRIIAELVGIFPDMYIHLGGDECEDYSQPDDFAEFLVDTASRHGKRVIFWDEALAANLPLEACVQAWRHPKFLSAARSQGHASILSAPYYLDLIFPPEVHHAFDPDADNKMAQAALLHHPSLAGIRAALEWYEARTAPLADVFEGVETGPVLGGEACLWGELVGEDQLDTRLWSRMPAIASRLWSGQASVLPERAQTDAHLRRIAGIRVGADAWLETLGLSPLEREHFSVLLASLEPVKWYARLLGDAMIERIEDRIESAARPYSVDSPLDRPVDFVDPESQEALRFARAKDKREFATRWRAQYPVIGQIAERMPQVREILPLSERLADLADVVSGHMTLAEFRQKHDQSPVAELNLALLSQLDGR